MKSKNMTALPIGTSTSRSLPPITYHYSLLTVLLLALACFALSPIPKAFGVSPPPDGGYPGANTAEGDNALNSLTTGTGNTANGFKALFSNTTGSGNTANGFSALQNNNADNNTANGANALFSNTTGSGNTADGYQALSSNTTGPFNTAMGSVALSSNTTGDRNTAMGDGALLANSTGASNTAVGVSALRNNTTAAFNTAVGHDALVNNNANGNAAVGYQALGSNTTGTNNAANGFNALFHNTTGSSNIALGINAGLNLTTGSNNIDIGNVGSAGESKKIRIGTRLTHTNTYIAGISGVTVAGGVGVIIDTNGHLGTVVSSERFKDQIKPMDKASEAILALKPVTFRYKHELDPDGIPQFGLVAEQVEKVNPDLVARDAKGEVYTVRYEAVNAMLLNEFLKEHRTVQEQGRKAQEQERTITQLKSTVAQQQKDFQAAAAHQQEQIEALTAGLQRVSAQVEMSRPAPQMALSNQ
jgi:uncharacterized coiled-coil protein SlyX